MDPQTTPQQTVSGISGGGELSLYQYFIASPLFAGFNDFGNVDRKLFLSEYVNMSSSLKNYFASTETAANIATVGLNYQFDDSQVSRIATAIRELLTGKTFIKDFPMAISSKLGIDDIKAGEIANKITSQSFGPIIEDVKRIQRSKFPDKISQIQKESRPTGITQPGARPLPPRLEVKPQGVAPPPVRPPATTAPQRPSGERGSTEYNSTNVTPQPLRSVESIRPPQPLAPPEVEVEPRPLGPLRQSSSEASEARSEGVAQKSIAAQKSLEQELEKVSNVIDLRNKSEK